MPSQHYTGQLDVFSDGSYRLAPEVFGRSGAVAVAALFAVPLAALAAKRRWAAFVLGGFIAVLVLMLVPELFTRFSDAVSISQARRAAGFVPFAFAVAGGAAVLARAARDRRARRSGSPPGSRSSSPTPATSATRSTRAARRW